VLRRTATIIAAVIIGLGFNMTLPKGAMAQTRMQCPAMSAPTYTLSVDNRPVRIIDNADQNQMRQLFSQHNPNSAAGLANHHTIGGLHHGEITLRTQFNLLQASRDNDACLGLKSLDMTLVYDPVIYISRDRPPGSCEYNAAIEHEYKHQNTDLAVIRESMPMLRAAAQRAIAGLRNPQQIQTSDLAQAREQIQQQVAAQLDREMDRIEKKRNLRQAMVDTPAEYQRVANQCPNSR
jgi:hypothetical protein